MDSIDGESSSFDDGPLIVSHNDLQFGPADFDPEIVRLHEVLGLR
jgi:hypothetical protein